MTVRVGMEAIKELSIGPGFPTVRAMSLRFQITSSIRQNEKANQLSEALTNELGLGEYLAGTTRAQGGSLHVVTGAFTLPGERVLQGSARRTQVHHQGAFAPFPGSPAAGTGGLVGPREVTAVLAQYSNAVPNTHSSLPDPVRENRLSHQTPGGASVLLSDDKVSPGVEGRILPGVIHSPGTTWPHPHRKFTGPRNFLKQ